MGRFDHEAVCVDPRTGIVYLTEDKVDGLLLPLHPDDAGQADRGRPPAGHGLQGQARAPTPPTTRPATGRPATGARSSGSTWTTSKAPTTTCASRGHAAGAAMVARGEGVFWAGTEMFLTATSGGPLKRGQILRYVPSRDEGQAGERRRPGRVQLFVESADQRTLNMADNICRRALGPSDRLRGQLLDRHPQPREGRHPRRQGLRHRPQRLHRQQRVRGRRSSRPTGRCCSSTSTTPG